MVAVPHQQDGCRDVRRDGEVEGVGADDVETTRQIQANDIQRVRQDQRVDLHRGHPLCALRQAECQTEIARTDFEDDVLWIDVSEHGLVDLIVVRAEPPLPAYQAVTIGEMSEVESKLTSSGFGAFFQATNSTLQYLTNGGSHSLSGSER